MTIFIASDIHGSLPATEVLLSAFSASGAKTLVLLGDILNHGPRNPIPEGYNPAEVASRLNEFAAQIIAVRGNCDSEVDQMLLDFPIMADYAWLVLESGTRLFLTHGHLYNADKRPALSPNDVLVHGHTHIPVAQRDGEHFVFNPGSVTFPRNGFAPSYGLYDDGELKTVTFDDECIVSCQL